ncbi:MAG: uroporphyrinogen decarboxylase [Anaerolineae bacterium]|nr:uroporphyrinogen decarboxylase [Anaerolineae bacterium]
MNKRERLQAAIHGENVDRVPIALWRHWPGDDQRADDLAEAHIAFQKEFDWDFVKVSPSSSYCTSDWGTVDVWVGNTEGTREFTNRVINHPEDWLAMRVLEPDDGALGRQLRCLDRLQSAFGMEVPFIQTIFSPLAQAKNLAGADQLILHMRQNAGQVHHALQTITDTTIRFIHECKQRGIAGIYYAVQFANYPLLTEPEYDVLGRPYDLQILAAVQDLWLNVLHLHGPHGMFSRIADYPVQVVNWHDRVSPPDLAAGLKKIKGAASGGVDQFTLHDEDPSRSLAEAQDAFQQTGGKRFILGTGCVTMVTTPRGNLHRLRALAEDLKPA